MKGPAIFLLIYFVAFRRDLRYLVDFVISTVVIVGASVLVVPIELYWYYIVNVVPKLWTTASFCAFCPVAQTDNRSIMGWISLAGLSKFTPFVSLAGFGLFALFSFYVDSNKWADAFGKRTVRADAMFLLNVLVMLLFEPHSMVYPYVWIILPSALFLSALLVDEVKLAYLALVSIETFLLNSSPYPSFFSYVGRPMTIIPWALVGNLMMTISLVPIFICPTITFRNLKTSLSKKTRKHFTIGNSRVKAFQPF
jgi:hypothetical protein